MRRDTLLLSVTHFYLMISNNILGLANDALVLKHPDADRSGGRETDSPGPALFAFLNGGGGGSGRGDGSFDGLDGLLAVRAILLLQQGIEQKGFVIVRFGIHKGNGC
jgi:hypothetical protein